MRELFLAAGFLVAAMGVARAEGERAGHFDYYVMALSWSPSWCARRGDAHAAEQCQPGRGRGFILHGLWPQNIRGWPSWCRTTARDPSRRDSDAMIDLMGSAGLAWHQWKKHGRCSGLSGRDYYTLTRRAFDAVTVPALFTRVTQNLKLSARVVEEAFLEANPALSPDMVTVTCTAGLIQEVRICLDRNLTPRPCGPDIRRDCDLENAGLRAIR